MKKIITIEIDENTFKALNNAVIHYGDLIFACFLRCEVPTKFEKLKTLSDEELFARRDALMDMYQQIEKEFT